MVPYILAENPGIDSKRAFELSKEMMMGEKWNYFVLGLSFIGWAREKMIAVGYSNHIELKGFGEGVEF
ncbi:DUF975 family protein [Candidatus Galacturonibacter soehngenii]|uniref:DUF975 family protein n=1 Tax=Candidatus Galacturonatibacter soehngenii TaxID=2307010 RepID=A0A7V7QNX5_9FIRM|nr:DUF975 family protein [Candidatus Galacturonibacter soehngenii]KAB1440977.1 DUF975 family protein [Candidatus Galacturonibacter soehngenii]